MGAWYVALHGEMSGSPPREPRELRLKPKDKMLRLLTPMLGEPVPPLALCGEPQDSPPIIPEVALLSPPRCGKERDAGWTEDVEEPTRWRCAAK